MPPTTRAPIPRTEEPAQTSAEMRVGATSRMARVLREAGAGRGGERRAVSMPEVLAWFHEASPPWNAALKQTAEAGSVLVPSYVRRAI